MKRLVFFLMLVFAVCAVQAQTTKFKLNKMVEGYYSDNAGEWVFGSEWERCEKTFSMMMDLNVFLIEDSNGYVEMEVFLDSTELGTGSWEGYVKFIGKDRMGRFYTFMLGSEEERIYIYRGKESWLYKIDFDAGVF